jgi:hypothetical protein
MKIAKVFKLPAILLQIGQCLEKISGEAVELPLFLRNKQVLLSLLPAPLLQILLPVFQLHLALLKILLEKLFRTVEMWHCSLKNQPQLLQLFVLPDRNPDHSPPSDWFWLTGTDCKDAAIPHCFPDADQPSRSASRFSILQSSPFPDRQDQLIRACQECLDFIITALISGRRISSRPTENYLRVVHVRPVR